MKSRTYVVLILLLLIFVLLFSNYFINNFEGLTPTPSKITTEVQPRVAGKCPKGSQVNKTFAGQCLLNWNDLKGNEQCKDGKDKFVFDDKTSGCYKDYTFGDCEDGLQRTIKNDRAYCCPKDHTLNQKNMCSK